MLKRKFAFVESLLSQFCICFDRLMLKLLIHLFDLLRQNQLRFVVQLRFVCMSFDQLELLMVRQRFLVELD